MAVKNERCSPGDSEDDERRWPQKGSRMLASEELVVALNQQVGHEMGASMQYISIASYFASQTLNELSRFFYRQADEERDHAMKFIHFIVDAEATVKYRHSWKNTAPYTS